MSVYLLLFCATIYGNEVCTTKAVIISQRLCELSITEVRRRHQIPDGIVARCERQAVLGK